MMACKRPATAIAPQRAGQHKSAGARLLGSHNSRQQQTTAPTLTSSRSLWSRAATPAFLRSSSAATLPLRLWIEGRDGSGLSSGADTPGGALAAWWHSGQPLGNRRRPHLSRSSSASSLPSFTSCASCWCLITCVCIAIRLAAPTPAAEAGSRGSSRRHRRQQRRRAQRRGGAAAGPRRTLDLSSLPGLDGAARQPPQVHSLLLFREFAHRAHCVLALHCVHVLQTDRCRLRESLKRRGTSRCWTWPLPPPPRWRRAAPLHSALRHCKRGRDREKSIAISIPSNAHPPVELRQGSSPVALALCSLPGRLPFAAINSHRQPQIAKRQPLGDGGRQRRGRRCRRPSGGARLVSQRPAPGRPRAPVHSRQPAAGAGAGRRTAAALLLPG